MQGFLITKVNSIILDLMNCGAILALPFLLREDPKFFFDDKELRNVQPRIRCSEALDFDQNVIFEKITKDDASFKVYVESILIAEVKDFVQAVSILMSVHYIFNVNYSEKLHGTYMFIQKFILDINDNTNCPTKVLNLKSKLRKSNLI